MFLKFNKIPTGNFSFSHESIKVARYYENVCFAVVANSSKKLRFPPIQKRLAWKSLFIFTRIILAIRLSYNILLAKNYFVNIHGPLTNFDCIELPVWIAMYFVILGPDMICQDLGFIRGVNAMFNMMDSLWVKLSVNLEIGEKIKIRTFLRRSVDWHFYQFM